MLIMSYLRKTIKISSFILIAFSFLLIIKISYQSLNEFLSVNKPIKANLLIVEGWMSDKALQTVSDEFKKNNYNQIITTGLEAPEYYPLTMNGLMIFYNKEKLIPDTKNKKQHTIDIVLYGETGGKNKAHFNLYINDSLIKDFYALKRKKKYTITWNGNINDLDSIIIHFDNDMIGSFGDRNLYVKEVIIDRKKTISYKNNSVYNVMTTDRKERRVNNYRSYAETARNKLIDFGIDSTKIIALSGGNFSINRTFMSALVVRDYFKLKGIRNGKINIVSIGSHGRRSWMTYKSVLGELDFECGIISLDIFQENYSNWKKTLDTLTEIVEIFYYKLILKRYQSK